MKDFEFGNLAHVSYEDDLEMELRRGRGAGNPQLDRMMRPKQVADNVFANASILIWEPEEGSGDSKRLSAAGQVLMAFVSILILITLGAIGFYLTDKVVLR